MEKDPEYHAIGRFCKLGYNGQIADDVIDNYQGTGKSAGLAYLTCGMKIKHFTDPINYIGRSIRDSRDKLGVNCVMIDATDNKNKIEKGAARKNINRRADNAVRWIHDVVVVWPDGANVHLFY